MKNEEYIYGINPVLSYLRNNKSGKKIWIFLQKKYNRKIQTIINISKKMHIPIILLSKNNSRFQKINHQGIILLKNEQILFNNSIENLLNDITKNTLLLVLERIQDPQNLGACLRSAAAANVQAVIISKFQSSPITQTVRKVSCGSEKFLNIYIVKNLSSVLKKLKKSGVWIIGLTPHASKIIYQINFKIPIAIIAGNEGTGLRNITMKYSDYLTKIPILNSTIESLNVSVSIGITLFEIIRQRMY